MGYLMGLHYRSTCDAIDKLLIVPSLDWSWLASPKRKTASTSHYQSILTSLFRIGRDESFCPSSLRDQDKNLQDVPESLASNVSHENHHEIDPVMDMLEVLNHLFRTASASVQGGPMPRTLAPLTAEDMADQTPLHAVFILWPLLLLGHDNIAQQRGWVESWLRYWQCPSEWGEDAMMVGLSLAQVMKSADTQPSAYLDRKSVV